MLRASEVFIVFGFCFSVSWWNFWAVIFCVHCEALVSAEYDAMHFLAGPALDLFVPVL